MSYYRDQAVPKKHEYDSCKRQRALTIPAGRCHETQTSGNVFRKVENNKRKLAAASISSVLDVMPTTPSGRSKLVHPVLMPPTLQLGHKKICSSSGRRLAKQAIVGGNILVIPGPVEYRLD